MKQPTKGSWKPGQSGNPKGRAPSTLALSEYIRANIEPREIAEIAIGIARRGSAEDKDRLAATKFLAEHGWSKPVVQLEVESTVVPLDLSGLGLTVEQIDQLAAGGDDPGE